MTNEMIIAQIEKAFQHDRLIWTTSGNFTPDFTEALNKSLDKARGECIAFPAIKELLDKARLEGRKEGEKDGWNAAIDAALKLQFDDTSDNYSKIKKLMKK